MTQERMNIKSVVGALYSIDPKVSATESKNLRLQRVSEYHVREQRIELVHLEL